MCAYLLRKIANACPEPGIRGHNALLSLCIGANPPKSNLRGPLGGKIKSVWGGGGGGLTPEFLDCPNTVPRLVLVQHQAQ